MKVRGYYTHHDKSAKITRTTVGDLTWAANQSFPFELSRLPAGEYLNALFLVFECRLSQDGNGGDGISRHLLVNLIEQIRISDMFGTHLELSAWALAQYFKLSTGHPPILPDDIAASTGASTVYSNIKWVIPFYYSQWRYAQPYDFAYPTTLLQDANITIKCAGDLLTADHASNAVVSATLKIVAETFTMDKAQIPPTPEIRSLRHADMSFQLPRGNYNYIWISEGFKYSDRQALTTVDVKADGMNLVDQQRLDIIHEIAMLEMGFVDDYSYYNWVFNVLNNSSYTIANGKQVPPELSTTYKDTYDFDWCPLFYPLWQSKISNLIRVENRMQINMGGTAHDKTVSYCLYLNHTASSLENKALMMGFSPGAKMAAAGNKRGLASKDAHLQNCMPIILGE